MEKNQLLQTEQAVIAGLLSRPGSVYEVSGRLRAEMFGNQDLGFVYRSILSLMDKGVGIDMLTVENEMERLDKAAYDHLNGLSFLSEMLVAVRTDHHIVWHANEIVRKYLLRFLSAKLQEKQLAASLPDAEVPELLMGIDDVTDRVRSELASEASIEDAGSVASRVLEISYGNQWKREQGDNCCIATGLSEYDTLAGGLFEGELTVLAARPSMGKSAVALWMALRAARSGKAVSFFSVEMSKDQIGTRLLSMISGVDSACLRYKGTNEQERGLLGKAQEELAHLPLTIEYCGSDTIDDMRAKAMMLHKQGKLDLLFIDYLNLINIGIAKNTLQETTDLALGNIARKAKLMAEEMQVPVVLLAQLNRESEKRPAPHFPVLSDLRNSGAIEQVADVVTFVYRAEKYNITFDKNTKEDLRGVGLLLLAKNRNGATGIARFRYNPAMSCLSDYSAKLF
ncbi:replicative DNA helicase [Parabacteroides bouchesdurhonensis]|uniref:replicative DNA helicase n=1 Tax=Parabacteroides bouchesdurhonensis TaxID=1936995 RepID=UPI000E4F070F|nr:DnaB-like helicase C-terminal domain-containing protein [Parabacteroides bouchesdurhonensis]RHJ95417.1 DNA helicase [Bacteroides sp. AM07-16]